MRSSARSPSTATRPTSSPRPSRSRSTRAPRARASTSTDDPLLHARLFSYLDTQLTRLGGPNFDQIPINRPAAPVNDNHRDGFRQQAVHRARAVHPELARRRLPVRRRADGGYVHVPAAGRRARRSASAPQSFDDHFSQATLFWNSMTPPEQDHIVGAFSFELAKCEPDVIARGCSPTWPTSMPTSVRGCPPTSASRRRRATGAGRRELAGAVAGAAAPGPSTAGWSACSPRRRRRHRDRRAAQGSTPRAVRTSSRPTGASGKGPGARPADATASTPTRSLRRAHRRRRAGGARTSEVGDDAPGGVPAPQGAGGLGLPALRSWRPTASPRMPRASYERPLPAAFAKAVIAAMGWHRHWDR